MSAPEIKWEAARGDLYSFEVKPYKHGAFDSKAAALDWLIRNMEGDRECLAHELGRAKRLRREALRTEKGKR